MTETSSQVARLQGVLAAAIEGADHSYHVLLCAVIQHGVDAQLPMHAFCDHYRRYRAGKLVMNLYAICRAKSNAYIPREKIMPICRAKMAACTLQIARPSNYIDLGCGSGVLADCLAELCNAHYVCKVDQPGGRAATVHIDKLADVDTLWCKANGLPVKWDLISHFTAHRMAPVELFETAKGLLAKKGQLFLRTFDVQNAVDRRRIMGLLAGQLCNDKVPLESESAFAGHLVAQLDGMHLTSQTELLKLAEEYGWCVVGKPCVWNQMTREYAVLLGVRNTNP